MEVRELICINCPMGCPLKVEMEDGAVRSVSGNTCPRGADYARKEVTNPTRIVTSSVPVTGASGGLKTVSVKTAHDIPKGEIFHVVQAIKGITAKAPVHIGDVILHDAAGTGVDMIATREVL